MPQKLNDVCTRCSGTGRVFDEVFEYEWTACPYMDVAAGVACLNGRIVPIEVERGYEEKWETIFTGTPEELAEFEESE